jgi:hypothetical protein
MTSKINIDGVEYDLRSIADRSKILQILKERMEGCDEDYVSVEGDFKIDEVKKLGRKI